MPNYIIFRCGNQTYQECLDRMLFGQTNSMQNYVSQVRKGDILFLHQVNRQFVEGPFFATSSGEQNIESDAWEGRFPQQVRVEKRGKTSKISKDSFDKFGLRFTKGNVFFDFIIPRDIGRKLVEEMGLEMNIIEKDFSSYDTLDNTDVDIRLRYPANYRCIDGHYVRSKNEVIIDDWLINHNIAHGYEKKIAGQKILCDFYIRNNKNEELYIEVWGLDDPKYLERKKQKEKIYKNNNLKLISITEKNVRNIDDLLIDELKKSGISI